jgi:hypothetical protein
MVTDTHARNTHTRAHTQEAERVKAQLEAKEAAAREERGLSGAEEDTYARDDAAAYAVMQRLVAVASSDVGMTSEEVRVHVDRVRRQVLLDMPRTPPSAPRAEPMDI